MSLEDDDRDSDLVRRIAEGEEAAFMVAYDRHADTVFGSLVRFLRDREAAAEVVQETYLVLWQRAAQFDATRGSLVAWLLTIARSRALDRLRAESRRPPLVNPGPSQASDDGEGWLAALGAGGAGIADDHDPAAEAERRWVRSVIRVTLADMEEAERSVLLLAYDGGLSQAEIAERLGWPIGTVKSRTRRALARLRARLVLIPELAPSPASGLALDAGAMS